MRTNSATPVPLWERQQSTCPLVHTYGLSDPASWLWRPISASRSSAHPTEMTSWASAAARKLHVQPVAIVVITITPIDRMIFELIKAKGTPLFGSWGWHPKLSHMSRTCLQGLPCELSEGVVPYINSAVVTLGRAQHQRWCFVCFFWTNTNNYLFEWSLPRLFSNSCRNSYCKWQSNHTVCLSASACGL